MTVNTSKPFQNLFLLYELGQVEELENFWHEHPKEKSNSLVIALSLDIEMKLTEKEISFLSARKYKKIYPNQLTTEDEMINNFFTDFRWKQFYYRAIDLPKTFQFMFRAYFQRVRYYSNLLICIMEAHPKITSISLFAPSEIISRTYGSLARREINVVIDCAKVIAMKRGIAIKILPLSLLFIFMRNTTRPFIFTIKRGLFSLFLIIWNRMIVILRRPRHPRLIISDHWRNVDSSIKLLKEGECIFLDRIEIRHINWRMIFRYRMRFVHSENFLSRKARVHIRKVAAEFNKVWKSMCDNMTPVFTWHGYSFDALLSSALDDIFENFEKILREIEGTYALYDKFRPSVVLLRASVSGQTHFPILSLAAKERGIPSLELQHGLEYLGPGSWSREHTAEYIAAYGPLVKKELLALGYASENIREIGSPRFDSHGLDGTRSRKESQKRFTVLCIAPDIRPFEIYDSYSAEDYFKAVARAVESLGEGHVIIKLRPGPADEMLLRGIIARIFSHVPYSIAQHESLPSVCARADAVVSCYSTAVLEALQFGMPVIIPALNPIDRAVVEFHFSQYRDAHALYISNTEKAMAETLTELAIHSEIKSNARTKAREFIARNFCFDGNSSRRYADLIIELAKRSVSV